MSWDSLQVVCWFWLLWIVMMRSSSLCLLTHTRRESRNEMNNDEGGVKGLSELCSVPREDILYSESPRAFRTLSARCWWYEIFIGRGGSYDVVERQATMVAAGGAGTAHNQRDCMNKIESLETKRRGGRFNLSVWPWWTILSFSFSPFSLSCCCKKDRGSTNNGSWYVMERWKLNVYSPSYRWSVLPLTAVT